MTKCNIRKVNINAKPEDLFAAVTGEDHPVFLDSRGGPNAEKSFIACRPCRIVRNNGRYSETLIPGSEWVKNRLNPMEILREILHKRKTEDTSSVCRTGAIGYVSYDYGRQIESLPDKNISDIPVYDLYFAFYNTILVYEHADRQWFMHRHPEASAEEILFWEKLLRRPLPSYKNTGVKAEFIKTNITKTAFTDMVNRTKEYIFAGDIYQANLSQRIELNINSHPYGFYNRLLEINPSPFSAFLKFGDVTIGSCSPERLFSLHGTRIETRPIAGTRPRGETIEKDSAMYEDLIRNEKERAEHLMLVDLERNDLGRVCRYGSVHVEEFMIREVYSHVWHIVSNIAGDTLPGTDALHCLSALFPGGTITGAPKIRAMEIIEEMEPVKRGIYTGSIGYLADNGDCDFNIVIRTFIVHGKKAYIQVGAGIVADSDPDKEYQETFDKAAALLRAAGVTM